MKDRAHEAVVSFFGPVRRPAGVGATTRVRLTGAETADAILATLGFVDVERARLRVMVSGRSLKPDEPIGDATEVSVFLPLGGG